MRIRKRALTFEDVLLVPQYSEVLPKEVSLESKLTRNISLKIPMVSAAMDTVTESELAIAIAQNGGLGMLPFTIKFSRFRGNFPFAEITFPIGEEKKSTLSPCVSLSPTTSFMMSKSGILGSIKYKFEFWFEVFPVLKCALKRFSLIFIPNPEAP